MKLTEMKKWMLSLAFPLASPCALAIDYELTLPGGNAGHIQVVPGETGYFTFDIRNVEARAGTAIGLGFIKEFSYGYTFRPSQQAECRAPYLTTIYPYTTRWNFPVDLAAGATIRCIYPVVRDATSAFDARFSPCTGLVASGSDFCTAPVTKLIIGTLPDVAISASPVVELPAGTTETVVRITVRNLSAVDLDSFRLETQCKPWLPQPNTLPYTLHTDLPGACPVAQINPGCPHAGQGVPPPVINWLVTVPGISAQGESSCLLRMRFAQSLVAPVVDTLGLRRYQDDPFPALPYLQTPIGEGRDVNAGNDVGLPFGAIPIVATPVPSAGRFALAALIFTLMALTGWRYRCRRLHE